MSDKSLTVKEWQKQAADRGVKESSATKTLVKALAATEKMGNASAADQVALLDEVEAAGRAVLKLHKGDKKLEAFFDEQAKALQTARKAAEAGDDEGAAWLEPKVLLKQLNLCKADPERNVHFAYVDGQDKAPGVLVLSPKVAAPALFKKLVAEVGVKTGAYGTTWVLDGDLMLQLDKPLGGLVKKLRAPVRASGFKVARIVLWNADGTVFEQAAATEDDGTSAAPGSAAPGAPAATAPSSPTTTTSASAHVAPTTPDAPATTSPTRTEAEFNPRLKALLPGILAAAGSKEGQAAKLLASEAGVFARKGDFAAAHAHLDKVDKLLARLSNEPSADASAPAATAASTPPAEGAALAPFDAKAWQRARERWMQASEDTDDQLNELRVAVIAGARSEPEYAEALAEIAGAGLNAITGRHRVQLAVALREVGDGAAPRWETHGPKALAAVTAFSQFVRTSPQLEACDANPFEVDVRLRATLMPALDELAAVLSAR